ncbi:hypothetical protein H7347_06375 [Corynebacterium sp. zg-331]|uniref:hypothetical protein n=1 Tax=unclassified Corynebacterium TaxID=2624378 RepID=UPI0013FF5D25|nr:hypothetical protein [Corynebacterium sp. zg-331]MPV52688.1 hypothetical protein [Corynebacterium sp. zg331]
MREEDFDDPRRPLLRALRLGSGALAAITVVSLVVWGWVAGLPGVWGVLVGAAVGGGFVLLTAASVLMTARTSPQTTGVVVLGGWLLKLVVVLVVMWGISGLDFYDRWSLLVTVVVVLVVVLVTETWGVMTSRVTYTNSRS